MSRYIQKAKDAAPAIQKLLHDRKQRYQKQPEGPSNPSVAPTSGDGANEIKDPTFTDILRYRYHHGTNLGSIFVLEKWLFPSMFPPNSPPNISSEFEGVKAAVNSMGIEAAREKFQQHWYSAVSESDFDWLENVAHCTSIRVPIGYFTLGPNFCTGTPFEPYGAVYQNCWAAVQNLVSRAARHGIGVLLDFHALPGGANTGEHSGTNSEKAELWNNPANLGLAKKCLCFIAQEMENDLDCYWHSSVIGIQLVNEAIWEAPGMEAWYNQVHEAISLIDPSIPIYISDAWNLSQSITYTLSRNRDKVTLGSSRRCPVVIDTHLYWAFTDTDKAKTPQQITSDAGNSLSAIDGREGDVLSRGAVNLVVGEYSCVMTDDSWAKSGGVPRKDLVKSFGGVQSARYQQRAGGAFFWTYKMDWMPGGEWGFNAMSQPPSAVPPPPSTTLTKSTINANLARAKSVGDQRMKGRVDAHVAYWNAKGGSYEHWRYEYGWKLGWNDASFFWGYRASKGKDGGDKIGFLELWVLKRINESGFRGGFVWEFEQGLRMGIADFYKELGV